MFEHSHIAAQVHVVSEYVDSSDKDLRGFKYSLALAMAGSHISLTILLRRENEHRVPTAHCSAIRRPTEVSRRLCLCNHHT